MPGLRTTVQSSLILCVALGGCKGETDRQRVTRINLKLLHDAVNQFRMDFGRYPSEEEGLLALVEPAALPPASYLEISEIPLDGWGRAFIYVCPAKDGRPFCIRSLGADGEEGGVGSDADLSGGDII